MNEKVKCLIIGSGPAGYTAAIYAARADLKPILYEGIQPGGQLTITTEVENFPGYPHGIQGPQLMENIKSQALRFNTDIRSGMISNVNLNQHPFLVTDENGNTLEAETIIIATGASAKWLNIEGEQKFNGYGVSACATCDGFFYKGKKVAVIGGGDTACEEAAHLSKLCSKVYLVHRRNELRASKAMQHKVKNTPNIELVLDAIPTEVIGKEEGFSKFVTGLKVVHSQTKEEKIIELDGIFVAIGHTPNSTLFKGQLEMDETGYIKTIPGSTHTSVKGIFAAGDIQDKTFRQAITAAGSGCMAAIEAERFLSH